MRFQVELFGKMSQTSSACETLCAKPPEHPPMKKKYIIAFAVLSAILISGLMAFLALNKSRQILDKFEEVNNSIDNTEIVKTSKDYSPENKTKVESLMKESNLLIEFINEMKDSIINTSEESEIEKFLFEKKNASKLREKLLNYKRYITKNFPEQSEEINNIQTDNFKDGNDSISWEKNYFADIPLAAALVQLSQFQSEARKVKENILMKLN